MKKVIAFYVVAVIVIVSGVCTFIYFFPSKTGINDDSTVDIQCVNKTVTDVSKKDAKELYNMLNDKEVHYDSGLACPFRDDFCIIFDGGISKDTFYISAVLAIDHNGLCTAIFRLSRHDTCSYS